MKKTENQRCKLYNLHHPRIDYWVIPLLHLCVYDNPVGGSINIMCTAAHLSKNRMVCLQPLTRNSILTILL